MPTLAVYCGSRSGADPRFAAAAETLGDLMAERGIDLVYGGGQVGLMGLIARRVLAGGRKVIGVIPELLSAEEIVFQDATELILVETMHQRKWLMAERADAFLILPGGYGTLDEMFEVVAWAQLRIHAKPVAVWNVAGFYDGLFSWLDSVAEHGFLTRANRGLLEPLDEVEPFLDRVAGGDPQQL